MGTKCFKIYLPTSDAEDAEPVAADNMVIVCDGLGAAGLNKHTVEGKIHTSAYLGARLVSRTANDFFAKKGIQLWGEDIDNVLREFKITLCDTLSRYIEEHNLQKETRGSSSQLLPTTLAMAVYRENEDNIDVCAIWAGDSRVYLLSSDKGLQYLSKDDVDGEFDAMDCQGQSTMCNSISGEKDKNFYINYKRYSIEKRPNLFLFVASDGCFDYFSAPMGLEVVIESAINSLVNGEGSDFIEKQLEKQLEPYYTNEHLRDDTSLAGVVFEMTDAEQIVEQFQNRSKEVLEDIKILHGLEKELQEIEKDKNNMRFEIKQKNFIKETINIIGMLFDEEKLTKERDELRKEILALTCMGEFKQWWESYGIRKKWSEAMRQIVPKMEKNIQMISNLENEALSIDRRNASKICAQCKGLWKKDNMCYRWKYQVFCQEVYEGILQTLGKSIEINCDGWEEEENRQLICEIGKLLKDCVKVFKGKESQECHIISHIQQTDKNIYEKASKTDFSGLDFTLRYNKIFEQITLRIEQSNVPASKEFEKYVQWKETKFIDEFVNISKETLRSVLSYEMYSSVVGYGKSLSKMKELDEAYQGKKDEIRRVWTKYKGAYEHYLNTGEGAVV